MTTMRIMTLDDVDLGMRLKSAAGWNQTQADWHRFLRLSPGGCFVASVDGSDVGTVASFQFGDVAWIAMVLVDSSARGCGVGTALMQHTLEHLDHGGVGSVRLDATPMGRPIYEKLGFEAQFELARYAGRLTARGGADADVDDDTRMGGAIGGEGDAAGGVVRELVADDLSAVAAFDEAITSTQRRPLLEALFDDRPLMARGVFDDQGRVRAFMFMREGANAIQIGPAAGDDDAILKLMHGLPAAAMQDDVFVDLPLRRQALTAWAEASGLAVQRPLYRMCRGRQVTDDERLACSSGPEKG